MERPYQKPALLVVHCCVVFEFDPEDASVETVSALALDAMDELRRKLIECLLVLQTLSDEADLNFVDLISDLQAVHRGTQEAYRAASLVHQGAQLDGRWGNSLSKPKAVFARHNSAVRRGAKKVIPMSAPSDLVEQSLYHLPKPDRVQATVGDRPQCAGTVRSTGESCASSAMYLGSGAFAAHCYSHATPAERERYRVYHKEIDARRARTYDDLRERQWAVGREILAHWISSREHGIEWLEKAIAEV